MLNQFCTIHLTDYICCIDRNKSKKDFLIISYSPCLYLGQHVVFFDEWTRRSPVHRTFVTFAFTSLHFILFSLRIAISRHFLSSSKNSAQKNRFSFEVMGFTTTIPIIIFHFYGNRLAEWHQKQKLIQLPNYTFQTPLPDQSYHLPFVRSHGFKNFFECRLCI